MSKGWPDPLNDKDEDFWEFDNMVNEYEWEQKRSDGELPHRQEKKKTGRDSFIVKHTVTACVIMAGLIVLSVIFPLAWIAFIVYLYFACRG